MSLGNPSPAAGQRRRWLAFAVVVAASVIAGLRLRDRIPATAAGAGGRSGNDGNDAR